MAVVNDLADVIVDVCVCLEVNEESRSRLLHSTVNTAHGCTGTTTLDHSVQHSPAWTRHTPGGGGSTPGSRHTPGGSIAVPHTPIVQSSCVAMVTFPCSGLVRSSEFGVCTDPSASSHSPTTATASSSVRLVSDSVVRNC